MKASDIKVGRVYRNRGAGRTRRKVVGIGLEFQPERRYSAERPDEMPGVEYEQGGSRDRRRLWLDSFASWAGSEVE